MKATTICNILDQHYVPFYEENGRIYADSMLSGSEEFEEVVDVTDYTMKQLLEWLGY